MKKIFYASLLILSAIGSQVFAQGEDKYGRTLNLGAGLGYYGYVGGIVPVLNANYEFDVVRNFTLAPTVSFYTYSRERYWYGNNKNYPGYRSYRYRSTVIPIGVKGTYYFDELIGVNSKWDLYAAGSLGFAIVTSSWEDGYDGDRDYYRRSSPLFLDIHAGAEYHINERFGLYLDLSTGVSTFGIAIH